MADNKSSKSTDRAKRNASNGKTKGAVRQHRPKAKAAPLSQGDDVLTKARLDRAASAGIKTVSTGTKRPPRMRNAAQAANAVGDQLGTMMASVATREEWCSEARKMVHGYIKSLTVGDGQKPAGLSSMLCKQVENAFYGICSDLRVAWDTLPGQRTEWYLSRTARYRKPTEELAHAG